MTATGRRQGRDSRLLALGCVVLLLAVVACGAGGGTGENVTTTSSPPSSDTTNTTAPSGDTTTTLPFGWTDVEGLGGEENAAKFAEMYQAVLDAGETELVVYSAHAEESKGVYDAFMARFPTISVTGVAVTGPSLRERIEAEFGSGQHIASVVATGITSAGLYAKGGEFAEYVPFTLADADPDPMYFDPGGRAFAAGLSPMGIIYNRNKVSDEEAPKSWADLIDPKWKGRISVQNPGVASGANGTLAQLLYDGKYGEEWLTAYSQQDLRIESTGPAAATNVANGIVDVAGPVQYSYARGLQEQGANVGFVFPVEDKNYYVANYMGLVSEAPHPNAAKLFLAWILTPEGAERQAETGFYTPVRGSAPPEGLPPYEEIETLNGVPFERYEEYSEYTQKVFGYFGG